MIEYFANPMNRNIEQFEKFEFKILPKFSVDFLNWPEQSFNHSPGHVTADLLAIFMKVNVTVHSKIVKMTLFYLVCNN